MTPAILMLILNIVFVIFIGVGFLQGLCGVKKSALKFTCFIVGIVLSAFLTPVISKAVMQIQLSYNGQMLSLSEIVLDMINQSLDIQDITSATPALAELFQNVPLMVGNLLVFIILCYIMSFISWVIYKVLALVFIKKDPYEMKQGKKVKVKTKKYRLWGGAIGVVQGFILMFVTFAPISGIVGLVNELSTSTVVVAEETVDSELSPTATLLNENLPKDIKELLVAYDKTAVGWTTSIFGLDNVTFNNISSIRVNDYTISLRDEILNLSNVYDNVSFLLEIDFNDISSLKVINYSKVEKAINYVFESNMLKSVMSDLVNYGFDEILKLDDIKNSKDYTDAITLIKNEFNTDGQILQNLKTEFLTCIDTLKLTADSGLLEMVVPEEDDSVVVNEIIDLLSKNNNELFNQLVDKTFGSKLITATVPVVVNMGINELETLLENEFEKDVSLGRVDVSNTQLAIRKQDLKLLGGHFLNVYHNLKDIDSEEVKNNYTTLFSYNLGDAAISLGSAIDVFKNMPIFSSTGIYENLLEALDAEPYNQYIDFEVLKTNSVWTTEMQNFAKVFNAIVKSNAISYIEKTENGYTISDENISKFIACLAEKQEVNGISKTYIRQTLEPLFESKALKKSLELFLEELGEIIDGMGDLIVEDAKLGKLYIKDIYNETEQEKILAFFDNAVAYVKEIDVAKLKQDPFMVILKSNLARLGSALDSIKNTSLFSDYKENNVLTKGIYTNLIETLMQTEYVDYIGFDSMLENDFSWNSELALASPMVDALVDKQIEKEDGTKTSLIEFIIEGGDWEVIFKQITKEDLTEIFTPLLESKIFKPTAIMALNKINEEIKSVVGEYGDIIPNIEDISPEDIEQIVEIIGDASALVEDFTKEDFNISDLATGENKEKLSDLLTSLQDNANSDGVFKETYEALVDYVKNDETIGAQVSDLTSQYEEGEIDWAQVLEQLIK